MVKKIVDERIYEGILRRFEQTERMGNNRIFKKEVRWGVYRKSFKSSTAKGCPDSVNDY